MARKKAGAGRVPSLFDARVTTAPCVPAVQEKLREWRGFDLPRDYRTPEWPANGYKGITDTTRRLLSYWFYTDHRLPTGRRFKYGYYQQEAVEALIYLYEVGKVRSQKRLIEAFAH